MEKDYVRERMHLMLTEDASGNLLGMYGLHETLESLRGDLDSHGLFREKDRTYLVEVIKVVELGLTHGLRYGMPMRVSFVETI